MNSTRIWAIGAVAVMVAVLALGWFLGVSPKLAEADASAAERAAVEQQNLVLEQTLVALRAADADLPDLEKGLVDLSVGIPSVLGTEDFVDSVYGAAVGSGVVLTRITIGDLVAYGSAIDGAVAPEPVDEEATPLPEAPPGANTIAVTIEASGEGANMVDFVNRVQNGKRIMLATGFGWTLEGTLGTINGFLFVIVDPNAPVAEPDGETTEEPTPESTPAPSETPTPTPTATEG